MKRNYWLSQWMTIVILILTSLPAYGASKPVAAEKKAPIMEAPSKDIKKAPAQRQLKIPTAALPDLVVTDIALDNSCRLAITIQNIGREAVEPSDLQRANVKITPSGARATELRMALLMPGMATLKPGAKAKLKTTVVVDKSGQVTVEADSRRVIAETNENNNRLDRNLAPRCAKTTDTGRGKPARIIDQPAKPMLNLKQPAKPGSGEANPTRLLSGETHGIAVLEPSRHRVYSQGSLVSVTWSDANPADEIDAESGTFVFVLRHEGSESCLTCGPEAGRGSVAEPQYMIQIPEYMTSGPDYYVRVYMEDNPAVYGDSDVFSIGPASEEAVVDLHEPPPCPDYVDPMYCHDNSRFRVDQPIGFTIRRSGDSAVIGEIVSASLFSVHHSAPSVPMALTDHGSFTQAEFSWTPPPGTAVPVRYRIEIGYRFAHDAPDTVRYVNSEDFFLNPPWWVPDTSGHNQIVVTRPEAGDTVYTGTSSQMTTGWRCESCDDLGSLSYARILLKGGEELLRIGPTPSGGEATPLEYFNILGYLNGADYQVRIELFGTNEETGEREMISAATSGYFTILNNRMDLPGVNPLILVEPGASEGTSFAVGTPMHISWRRSPPASAGYRVRLSLTQDTTQGGGQWPIAANIPATPNSLDWTIPGDIPPGAGYRVLIEQIDGTESSNSYIPFSITP